MTVTLTARALGLPEGAVITAVEIVGDGLEVRITYRLGLQNFYTEVKPNA